VAPLPPPKLETFGFNGQRGLDYTGRLAPEYEGDTRERYSNPYAQRRIIQPDSNRL
jgi:hypothetical protein